MEYKESGFAIFYQIFCHNIYHLSKGKNDAPPNSLMDSTSNPKGENNRRIRG
jgi:hypothetical protein